ELGPSLGAPINQAADVLDAPDGDSRPELQRPGVAPRRHASPPSRLRDGNRPIGRKNIGEPNESGVPQELVVQHLDFSVLGTTERSLLVLIGDEGDFGRRATEMRCARPISVSNRTPCHPPLSRGRLSAASFSHFLMVSSSRPTPASTRS